MKATSFGHHFYMQTQHASRRKRAHLGTFHLNFLHYTNPWVAVAWSFFMPGFGHLLLGQYILGWILFIWEMIANVESNFNTAILYSFTGRFQQASQILQTGYLILIYGAVFVFTLYSCYKISIETNDLLYLANKEDATKMRFIASFNHSIHLEKAITALESIGVLRENIIAAPLDKRNQNSVWFDTVERSDGKSMLDAVALLGALGCFFGTLYGFVLAWGPVLCGLIGFVGGCVIGGVFKLFPSLIRSNTQEKVPKTEVVVILDSKMISRKRTEPLPT